MVLSASLGAQVMAGKSKVTEIPSCSFSNAKVVAGLNANDVMSGLKMMTVSVAVVVCAVLLFLVRVMTGLNVPVGV
jgi:hypothetical protein